MASKLANPPLQQYCDCSLHRCRCIVCCSLPKNVTVWMLCPASCRSDSEALCRLFQCARLSKLSCQDSVSRSSMATTICGPRQAVVSASSEISTRRCQVEHSSMPAYLLQQRTKTASASTLLVSLLVFLLVNQHLAAHFGSQGSLDVSGSKSRRRRCKRWLLARCSLGSPDCCSLPSYFLPFVIFYRLWSCLHLRQRCADDCWQRQTRCIMVAFDGAGSRSHTRTKCEM